MGKAAELLKDKGAVVSVFPADYSHSSSPTPERSHVLSSHAASEN